jgi:hypothetical protein
MDDAFPFADSKYEQTAPVFLEVELGTDPSAGGVERLHEAFQAQEDPGSVALATLYHGLLLATAVPLPQPELSISYLVIDGDDLPADLRQTGVNASFARRIGPCERDLLVYGSQYQAFVLDAGDLERLQEAVDLLSAGESEIEALMVALIRTARPGFSNLNATLHLVAGLEVLLVQRGEPLTATFGRRFSVLAAAGDAHEYDALGRALYSLRSDLVHGREVDTTDTPERTEFLKESIRQLTCLLALRALRWFTRRPDSQVAEFQAALDAAFNSPDAFDALRAEIMERT